MSWIAPVPAHVDEGPYVGPVRAILQGYLDGMRTALPNICAGLTAEQLAERADPPSTLSLLGLVRHMAKVERTWLRIRVAGENVEPLFPRTDEDFDDVDPGRAEAAMSALQAEWAACDAAVADLSLDRTFDRRGTEMSLGLVYVHLVAEYARHNGHADLLRQSIDGVTGR
ncbi:MAG TPA: DinB family protein [Mycobacteriales bacterium]